MSTFLAQWNELFGGPFVDAYAFLGNVYTVVARGNFYGVQATRAGSSTVIYEDTALNAIVGGPTIKQAIASWGGSSGASALPPPRTSGSPIGITPINAAANMMGFWVAMATVLGHCTDSHGTINAIHAQSDGGTGQVVSGVLGVSNAAVSNTDSTDCIWTYALFTPLSITTQWVFGFGSATSPQINGSQQYQVVINNRRFMGEAFYPDLGTVKTLNTKPYNGAGIIIGPGNPSVVQVITEPATGGTGIADVDIDLQDNQQIFTPIGQCFTTLGSIR